MGFSEEKGLKSTRETNVGCRRKGRLFPTFPLCPRSDKYVRGFMNQAVVLSDSWTDAGWDGEIKCANCEVVAAAAGSDGKRQTMQPAALSPQSCCFSSPAIWSDSFSPAFSIGPSLSALQYSRSCVRRIVLFCRVVRYRWVLVGGEVVRLQAVESDDKRPPCAGYVLFVLLYSRCERAQHSLPLSSDTKRLQREPAHTEDRSRCGSGMNSSTTPHPSGFCSSLTAPLPV